MTPPSITIPHTDLRGDALLRFVAEWILEHPENFGMGSWLSSCGTIGCIAGLAEAMTGSKRGDARFLFQERYHLEFDLIFHVDYWPLEFAGNYNYAMTHIGRAQVAYDRIQHFLKTRE